MPRWFNGLALFLVLAALAFVVSCAEVVFPGNGLPRCGSDQDGGRCPSGQTCCQGGCYDRTHLPACLAAADAAPGDASETGVTDVADASDAAEAAVDASVTDIPDADVATTDAPDVAIADADAAVDVPDTDADVVSRDVPDVQDADTDVPDADAGRTDAPDVVIMDVQPDIADVPADLPRDVVTDTLPDVTPDVPTDRPPVDTGCTTGQLLCGMTCIDSQTSMTHCGRCNNPCPSGTTCTMGACQCPMGQTLCGTTCVDTQMNSIHCGRCDNACSGTMACVVGTCLSLSGRLTLRARRASIFYSDYNSTVSLESVREGMASSQFFDNSEFHVAAYRYMGTSRLRLARVAMRFDRISLPPTARVRAIFLQIQASELADNPPQRAVVVPFRPPTTAWHNSHWPLGYWGVTPVSGMDDIPTLWSAELPSTAFTVGMPTQIPLIGSAITELAMSDNPTVGMMEVHDAYGRALDPLPSDGTRFARIAFLRSLTDINLLVDYGP